MLIVLLEVDLGPPDFPRELDVLRLRQVLAAKFDEFVRVEELSDFRAIVSRRTATIEVVHLDANSACARECRLHGISTSSPGRRMHPRQGLKRHCERRHCDLQATQTGVIVRPPGFSFWGPPFGR